MKHMKKKTKNETYVDIAARCARRRGVVNRWSVHRLKKSFILTKDDIGKKKKK